MCEVNKKKFYFSKFEVFLWAFSMLVIVLTFVIFDGKNYLSLSASLVGATALIFNAKGNPFGQILMIAFGVLYGIISWGYAYYGEVMTYLGMTVPMAFISLVSWLKNPYKGNKSEVKVNKISWKEVIFMLFLTALVTVGSYYLLSVFGTANILPSTISVSTSFTAAYLTFRRSPYYAVAYALNDVVLIILWVMATIENVEYVSVIICFVVFLINDLYAFINWLKMQKRQKQPG